MPWGTSLHVLVGLPSRGGAPAPFPALVDHLSDLVAGHVRVITSIPTSISHRHLCATASAGCGSGFAADVRGQHGTHLHFIHCACAIAARMQSCMCSYGDGCGKRKGEKVVRKHGLE